MAMVFRGGPHRIQVLSDRRETEIRDPRMAGVIHEDVWLGTCQYGRKTEPISMTYPFEIAVYHITEVKKVKTPSNIR